MKEKQNKERKKLLRLCPRVISTTFVKSKLTFQLFSKNKFVVENFEVRKERIGVWVKIKHQQCNQPGPKF